MTERLCRRQSAIGPRRPETVVFVHHFGGTRASSARHQKLMNELGYDTYAFDLPASEIPRWRGWWPRGITWGRPNALARWSRDLTSVLDQIDGPKVIFSFSFPSAAVAAALGDREVNDVRAWICDGGPFLHLFRCQFNLFTYAAPTPPLRRFGLSVLCYLAMGGPLYAHRVRRWVEALKIPVLSLRAGRDRLVPPAAIAAFFGPNAAVEEALLPEAGHLEGLKTFPARYAALISAFCDKVQGRWPK